MDHIDASDTLITVEMKDGRVSNKIPFYEFLKEVVGVRLRKEIHLNLSGFMPSDPDDSNIKPVGACTNALSNETENKIQDELLEGSNTTVNASDKIAEETKSFSEDSSHDSVKQKGKGRPSKLKTKDEQQSNSKKKTDTPGEEESGLPISTSVNNQSHFLRRSRRTPARNTRFREDFVDSTTLWSKGSNSSSTSSSWNTQLMTLALAAERHVTKPNEGQAVADSSNVKSGKNTLLTRKRTAAMLESTRSHKKKAEINESVKEDLSAVKLQAKEENGIDDIDKQDKCNYSSNDKSRTEDNIEFQTLPRETATSSTSSSVFVLKRSLNDALEHALLETNGKMSGKPLPVIDEGKHSTCSTSYYVIMDPKLNASGEGMLVQKSNNGGIAFDVAHISGKTPNDADFLHTLYPLDRLYACDSCDVVFNSAHGWLKHNEDTHEISVGLTDSIDVLQRKEIHPCPSCDERFPYAFMLENHQEKCKNSNSDPSECSVCKTTFSNVRERDHHYFSCHQSHSCILCGKEFDSIIAVRRHMKFDCVVGENKNNAYDKLDEEKEEDVAVRFDGVQQGDSENPIGKSATVFKTFDKIVCDLCQTKFSTFSGLWHHKLDIHHQFYPPGFRNKMLERLEKNQVMIKSTLSTNDDVSNANPNTKNKYYVMMHPKWTRSKFHLKVDIINKEFTFSATEVSANTNKVNHSDLDSDNFYANSKDRGNAHSASKSVSFSCNECQEIFPSANGYREHRSNEHGECFEVDRYLGAFQCSQCSDTFPCQYMLDEHVKCHSVQKTLPCTMCDSTFLHNQERQNHWRKDHPGVSCPNCGKMYSNLKFLQKHISLNCQDDLGELNPSEESLSKSKINSSNSRKQVEKKIIKCHLCSKICPSIHCWRRHMSDNHEADGFSKQSNTCFICNKVVLGHKALEKHLLQEHAEDTGLPIEKENKILQDALKKSKVTIVDYQKAGKDGANIYLDDEGYYHCPECPKTNQDHKAMMLHLKTHVNMNLECTICQRTYKNPTLLRQHIMRHRTEAIYSCSTCDKKFSTLQKLNKHNKLHHSKESFVCELCGMSFALNDYLLKHKRCHTDNRPHSCSVCGKTFRTKPELRVHVLIHTQETPYVCEHCGRGFTQKGNYRIHLAQHTGKKPHKCDQCNLSFALPSHLKRHSQTHDQKVNYRCIWCDKECTQRKHMQMHVTRVHKENFFQYEEHMKLEMPVPIAPSQMKMYNRRFNKGDQVRKQYRTRAKKCHTTSQDIMEGTVKLDDIDENGEELPDQVMKIENGVMEPLVESVTTDLALGGQSFVHDATGLQILVNGDSKAFTKHDINTAELISAEDSSNVEIVMGENNEINIIINNADHGDIGSDLAIQESLAGEVASVAAAYFPENGTQIPNSFEQAVHALVNGSKDLNRDESMTLDIESLAHGSDTYTIVYPS